MPASERRDAIIEVAVHEFAHGGLHGTPVDRIARRVGVAQRRRGLPAAPARAVLELLHEVTAAATDLTGLHPSAR